MRLPKKGFLGYLKQHKPKGHDGLEKWWDNWSKYRYVKELKCTKAG